MVADVAGKISFDANGLGASTEQGRASSASAIDSIEAIAFHLAAVRMNIQGHTQLAAVLVHDHFRAAVARLGPSVYDRMFSPIRDQEEGSVRYRWFNPSSPLQRVHRTR